MEAKFICPQCGATYPANEPLWRCECGSYLDLDYHPVFKKESVLPVNSVWRYSSVLPLDNLENAVSFNEGMTPLTDLNVSGVKMLAKLDYMMPSGSFKDRGASLMISRCKELGIEEIVEDSSGNSACAISAYCARAGIKANIYMPAGNSSAKSVQAKAYGADLHLIPGNRIDVADAAVAAAENTYYAAHAWNPYFLHGTKTGIYEIVEQLGWSDPDYLFIPVGSGSQIIGAYLGIQEMIASGIIKSTPRLMAVQSDKCSPLKDFIEGRETVITPGNPTIAEGISIHKPVRLKQIIEVVRKSGGDFITVSDEEIIESQKLCSREGIYIEPTSASAVAAAVQCAPRFRKEDKVVVSLTGSGLKSTSAIEKLIS